ncbi:(2,3-dihydroxybenzoyl)adenylate synthase [Streptomyces camelliae]|uniref:AMP-binding protein n=1 Tax=Streptomyces camelliae TaxID=3004093 RepID=A0ABY7P3A0_9ACTN|nr:AMP-binding protein [Streptomyces sp. HUAS 2-6]WBO65003.1 AMP-binding protein [Streptomyces sp. HUAS 2-6]
MMRTGVVGWPREAADRYVASGLWRRRPLGSWVWDWADRYGHRTAVVDGAIRLSYREFAERTDSLAERLLGLGLKNGDNLLVQLPNCWEFLGLFLACQRIGVAPLLALPAHREHELAHLADLADVAAIVVPDTLRGFDHQSLAARIAAERRRSCPVLVLGGEPDPGHLDLSAMLSPVSGAAERRSRLDALAPEPEEVAFFLLSGGTTGLPKIIARTHNDYEYNVRRSSEICGFSPETVYLAVLPVAHNFALGCPGVLGALSVGGRVVMCPSPRAAIAFPELARERVTVTSVVPAVARTWLGAADAAGPDLESLRVLQVGGSVLPADLAQRLAPTLGCTLQQVFGMAEGLLNYTRLTDPPFVISTTQGRPISEADELLIVGPDGRPVEEGETGELLTRGPYTPRGYFRAPEHNVRAYTPDGWYRSGDLVRRHPSGNLVVEGRIKDQVNRGGEKIAIDEVEDLVRRVPEVADAAAVALPHPVLGECVGVCVVPVPGSEPTLARIRAHFEERGVAAFKHPDELRLAPTLPLTAVGKVDRKRLLDLFAVPQPTAEPPLGRIA